jgi:acyl-CoA thioesterase I
MRWWMWICFCVVLALPRTEAAQAGVSAQTHTTVLVLGDSLSAAYGLAPQQGWVALLQRKLSALPPRYRVVNASISGETTAGGRSRLRRLLNQHEPALVVIALGANDGLRGLPPASMEANLQAMAEAVGPRRKLVLAGMRLPPNYGASYDAQFRAVFTRIAQRHGAALVPFLLEGIADKRELFQSDGLHPTAAAQGLILQTVWPSIQRSLNEAMAGATRAKPRAPR